MSGIEIAALAPLFAGTATATAGAGAAATGFGATLAQIAPWVAGASAAVGTVGAIRQGNFAANAAEAEAKEQQRAGDEAFAEGQRRMQIARRQGELALGSARAMGAASGAGFSDQIETGIREQADYNAMVEFYGGRSRQNTFYGQAANTRASGRSARTAGYINAVGEVGRGVSSIYDIYY